MTNRKFLRRTTLREKCPNTYTGKYGPEKTPYLDTFHEVLILDSFRYHRSDRLYEYITKYVYI